MSKNLAFLISFLLLHTGILYAQPVKQYGQLKVTGTQLTSYNNKPVTLRGMSLGWHNWWPRFYAAETVNWLATDWKCSVARAAIGIEPNNGYLQKPELAKEKIQAAVDQAIKDGIYVIIDWHSHNIKLQEAKNFFTEMAMLYGRHPNVIYEIFNEPEHQSWEEVKAYSDTLISAIRKIDPDNIILIGTPHWDQDIHLAADDPLQGFTNIMYTVHFYAAAHKQQLRNRCTYALKKGLPLFISECAGMEATGNGPVNEKEWDNWISFAEEKSLSWVIWSVSDKNETCSVLKPTALNAKWKLEDLTPWGIKSRELLKKYNQ